MQRQREEERESFQQAQRQYSSLPRYAPTPPPPPTPCPCPLGNPSFPVHWLFHLRGTAHKSWEPWLTWPHHCLAGGTRQEGVSGDASIPS